MEPAVIPGVAWDIFVRHTYKPILHYPHPNLTSPNKLCLYVCFSALLPACTTARLPAHLTYLTYLSLSCFSLSHAYI